MKTIRITVDVVVNDDLSASDILLLESDVIDGFELTRSGDDLTDTFHMLSASVVEAKELKEPARAKIVGYQVLEANKEMPGLHPEMAGSFCIYSKSQCRKMIGDSFESNMKYMIVPVLGGQIEDPTFMFVGDCEQ